MGKSKVNKKASHPLLGQILEMIPSHILTRAIGNYQSDKHCQVYKTYDELVSMMFGQLNKCLSLREIAQGISIDGQFLKDIGLTQSPAKSTMSDGNKKRDYRVFEKLYYLLLEHYLGLFSRTDGYKVIKEIKGKCIKLVDATTISVCLQLFEWAKFRTAKGGIKVHTSLDEATMLPEIINITEAKVSDRRGADGFKYPKDTIVVDDRGYFDFKLFMNRIEDGNDFVTRIKTNTVYEQVEENELPDDKDHHILKDECIRLTSKTAIDAGIDQIVLRRVAVYRPEDNKTIELITNNLHWPATVIGELYKRRWRIETFFKLLKQNLQVKTFIGTNENACKSQLYIALITYLLLEIIRRHISKTKHCFGHFVTLIRVCLTQYNRLEYIVNEIKITVQKANKIREGPADNQIKMAI
jgi:hypothetical protein